MDVRRNTEASRSFATSRCGEHSPARELRRRRQVARLDAAPPRGQIDHASRQVGHRLERQLREVEASREAMERRIEMGARVRRQLDAPDVELGARRIACPRRLARQLVAATG
jgi:hypothetical protein